MKSLKLQICGEEKEIKVGDGATLLYYSDRKPATIIDIKDDGKIIVVQEDNAIRTDNNGMSDCQSYEFERNPKGTIHEFKRTRANKNMYTDNGKSKYGEYGVYLGLGYRDKYYDYSF